MEPMPRKPYFSVADRLQAVARLEQGKTIKAVAAGMGVDESTLRRWKRKSEKLAQVSSTQRANKNMRCAKNQDMEKELYEWLVQRRIDSQPLTGVEIRGKALQINSDTGGPANFAASEGWLSGFLRRYDITLSGKTASAHEDADKTAVKTFVSQFQTEVEEEKYDIDNIYNFDEVGVYYKAMPSRAYVMPTSQNQRRGTDVPKDRLTVGVCANASGTHKIPLLVLGNSAKPRCFRSRREMDAQSFKYHYNKKGWMTRRMLTEYVKDIFIPAVEARQLKEGCVDKVLLIVDNALSHKGLEENDFGRVAIQFLPQITTFIIHPMEQGITAKLKRVYRLQVVDRLLNANVHISAFYKTFTVRDACSLLASAWEDISAETLRRPWCKLLPNTTYSIRVSGSTPSSDTTTEIVTMMRTQEQLTEVLSEDEACTWFRCLKELEAVTEDPEGDGDGSDDSSDEDDGVRMPKDPRQVAIEAWETVQRYLALQEVTPHTIQDVQNVLYGEDEPNTDVKPPTFVVCNSEF